MAGILVAGEWNEDGLQSSTAELLAVGRSLASVSGVQVYVAVLGSVPESVSHEAISLGADSVYVLRDPLLNEGGLDAAVAAFEAICRQTGPEVMLFAKTAVGSEAGPRVAFRLGVGAAQDCIKVEVEADSNRVVVTRPVYGGNAMARLRFPGADPQVIVVRGKAYEPLTADATRQGQVVPVDVSLDPAVVKSRRVETVKAEAAGVRLEDASVVVGGGRGLGGPEPFEQLEELARLLGGAVGASRAVCDAGWLDHGCQIGLTGKTITPNLYITVGISGASQHMAGCSGAKHLVAINKDADSNIFKAASLGVVGDWKAVLPSFIETVRELVKS
ncbi:MAG: electron transfer flavoprotein subunit alpha/FixB family protein [Chloroflexi bacterium]|nr:electron transfer flavoprotein subunit alpha/FixB family protein [Chloroflexota bacterium]